MTAADLRARADQWLKSWFDHIDAKYDQSDDVQGKFLDALTELLCEVTAPLEAERAKERP